MVSRTATATILAVSVWLSAGDARVQTPSPAQGPVIRSLDEQALRAYTGVYRWQPDAFVYLQMWEEFSGFGKPQLVAFDEAGDVRILYRTAGDKFFAGPGIAVPESVESRIVFRRDAAGKIV